ncbi:MAG: replication initiation protein [Geminicoccaceae bacterium]
MLKNNKTFSLKPRQGEMIKPAELIDISGAGGISLAASKIYNRLLQNAFGPEMTKEGHTFQISLSELRGLHDSNDRVRPYLKDLQTTIVTAKLTDGKTRQVQLLGGIDIDDDDRKDGVLEYNFDPKLADLLRNSSIFAKLELRVIYQFTSKYALALYEAISRRIRMNKCIEDFTLDELRDLLRVPDGKLKRFAQLNQWAIQPALLEVNGLADFEVYLRPKKQGKSVVGVAMSWSWKDDIGQQEAWKEGQRSKIGRKARLTGTVETLSS